MQASRSDPSVTSGIADPQGDVIAFLDRDSGGSGSSEAIITTHISRVFIKREHVLKLKRAVRFPYLDFSTGAARLAACEREVALNRRTAPRLYLGVRRITREADGRLAFDGPGSLVDAVVEMRRFAETDLLDRMVQRGALAPAILTDLARRIADFHRTAPVSRDHGGAAGIAAVLDINDRALCATGLVPANVAADAAAAFRRALDLHHDLLEARREAGKVRHCHGDLTLRNICLFEGEPTMFDCIEFSADLAIIDVLYDLAFLLMDLAHRAHSGLANWTFNRYLDVADESDGLALLPFFMAIRAMVRAHVHAAQSLSRAGSAAEPIRAEALAYLDLALALLRPSRPRLVAIGGHSGTGKSTLAAMIAPALEGLPGARVLNSDRVRKAMYGVSPETRLPPEAYNPEVSHRVYDRLMSEAARALAGGGAVIVDAVFDRPEDRAAIEAVARVSALPFHGFWLEAAEATLAQRISARRGDPSDADIGVLRAQLAHDPGAIGWRRFDVSGERRALADRVLANIKAE